ncbi:MAG TPA: 5'-deoxyadenosine deaminase [Bacteroidota bacterium]|nr:5'-deoxyadenosine deaminase [Bacteroidota bacterium]
MSTVIRGGTIVTGNVRGEIIHNGTIVVNDSRIESILPSAAGARASGEVIDATGHVIIPGFVQTHVHLCQTLFRGMADDLELLDWLQKRIFPLEAAHNAESVHVSAMLGIAELIRSGTTTILDMGSIHHEEAVIRAVGESGLRAFVGKSMMDLNDLVPRFKEPTASSVSSTLSLARQWHNSYDGRVKYAVAPRFVLSCTDALLHEAFDMLDDFPGMLFHTHASENRNELEAVQKRCGMRNVEFLHHLGVLSDRSCLAHGIHLNASEISMLQSSRTNIAHCPSSNLKLASGIADVPLLLSSGINVSLGADGAPCNNTLDMFQEMRLASLMQKPQHGPTAMPAEQVFGMATRSGAGALGLGKEIGTLEPGKKADLVVLDVERIWNPVDCDGSPYSTIVHSGSPENVVSVMIDGRWLYRDRSFTTIDEEALLEGARRERKKLLDRM